MKTNDQIARGWLRLAAIMVAMVAFNAVTGSAARAEWAFSVGPAVRYGMDVHSDGKSYAQTAYMVLIPRGGGGSTVRGGGALPDDISLLADRTFDDGFVFMDPSTLTGIDGDTWYWGYASAGQVSADAGTLTFHRAVDSSVSRRLADRVNIAPCGDNGRGMCAELSAFGVVFEAQSPLIYMSEKAVSVAVVAGLAAFPEMDASRNYSSFRAAVERRRVDESKTLTRTDAYVYDLMGIQAPAPGDAGTYDGPGPLLPNRPMAVNPGADTTVSSVTRLGAPVYSTLRNMVTLDVDAELYEFRVGPRFGWAPASWGQVFLMPVASANLVKVDVTRRETAIEDTAATAVTRGEWRDCGDKTDVLFGVGVHGGGEATLGRDWFVGAAFGYDWLPATCNVQAGPETVELDFSAYSASAHIGRRF